MQIILAVSRLLVLFESNYSRLQISCIKSCLMVAEPRMRLKAVLAGLNFKITHMRVCASPAVITACAARRPRTASASIVIVVQEAHWYSHMSRRCPPYTVASPPSASSSSSLRRPSIGRCVGLTVFIRSSHRPSRRQRLALLFCDVSPPLS